MGKAIIVGIFLGIVIFSVAVAVGQYLISVGKNLGRKEVKHGKSK